MVGGAGGNWKRPVNRMYSYNYQVAGGRAGTKLAFYPTVLCCFVTVLIRLVRTTTCQ